MPTNIKCPRCSRALEIPNELMGKKVKCPACKMIFTAAADASASSSASGAASAPRAGGPPPKSKSESETRVRRKPPHPFDEEDEEEEEEEEETPRVRRKRRRDDDEDEEEEEQEERPRARRKPVRRRDEEDEDEDEEDEDEEEDRPRRRRKPISSSRQRASAAVLAPAICLMVVGGLGALAGIANAIILIAGISVLPADKEGPGGVVDGQSGAYKSGRIGGTIASISWGVVVLGGAMQMKSLTNRGNALKACIFAMLPCNPCCILGLPFGIWGLVTINRTDVRKAFDS